MDEEQLFGSGDSSSEDQEAENNSPANSDDNASVINEEDSSDAQAWGSGSEDKDADEVEDEQLADEEQAEDHEDEEERPDTPNPETAEEVEEDSDPEYASEDDIADQDSKEQHEIDSEHEVGSNDSEEEKAEVTEEATQEEDSDQDDSLAVTYAESEKSDEQENQERHSESGENESDDSEIGRRKVESQLDLTSSDDEEKGAEKVDNLFGDADDISSSDEDAEEKSEKQVRQLVTDDEEGGDEEEQDEEPKEAMETRIEVEIPKIKTDLGSAIHFVRFPNFISAEPRPFDPAVYEDEIEEDELLDEEGRTRLKLKVENTLRWRKYTDENNIELTESNARVVRWSDGTMSLHLGSEIFDVHQMSLQGDHNHLFIRQGTGLQGQAVFRTKLTFRPHSTKSATHKKMTNRLAMRHNQNQQKVRVLPIAGQDPESRKAALMKEEEDQLKAHMRREAQKRRKRERSHVRGLTSNYLDNRYDDGTTNDDDDEGISVSAIKSRFKAGPDTGDGMRRERIYSSDSDSDAEKRLINAKRLSSDDDDDDIGAKRRREDDGETRKKTYIVSDEEEEEDEAAMST